MTDAIKQHAPEMAAMFKSGQTLEVIGQRFGCTREYVRQCLASLGLSRKDGGQCVTTERNRKERRAALNEKSMNHRGMTLDEFQALPVKAKRAYVRQKVNAAIRGIEWKLTLPEWWGIWQKSGKWELRGRGGYCMGRKGDAGAYEAGNVYICTTAQNFSDSYIWKPAHMRNRRQARRYEYNGEFLNAAQLAEIGGMSPRTMAARLRAGWSVTDAVTTPVMANNTHLRRLQLAFAA